MNLLEWLQNLKQHSRPIGALCGKKFDNESQPFSRYGFPRVLQFFDTRTVQFVMITATYQMISVKSVILSLCFLIESLFNF